MISTKKGALRWLGDCLGEVKRHGVDANMSMEPYLTLFKPESMLVHAEMVFCPTGSTVGGNKPFIVPGSENQIQYTSGAIEMSFLGTKKVSAQDERVSWIWTCAVLDTSAVYKESAQGAGGNAGNEEDKTKPDGQKVIVID